MFILLKFTDNSTMLASRLAEPTVGDQLLDKQLLVGAISPATDLAPGVLSDFAKGTHTVSREDNSPPLIIFYPPIYTSRPSVLSHLSASDIRGEIDLHAVIGKGEDTVPQKASSSEPDSDRRIPVLQTGALTASPPERAVRKQKESNFRNPGRSTLAGCCLRPLGHTSMLAGIEWLEPTTRWLTAIRSATELYSRLGEWRGSNPRPPDPQSGALSS